MNLTGKIYLPNPAAPQWNAHSNDVRKMLGLPDKAKLPIEGLPPRIVHGIKVWVEPEPPSRLSGVCGEPWTHRMVKSSKHRIKAECPHCGWVGSAGRLHQHVCKEGLPAEGAK